MFSSLRLCVSFWLQGKAVKLTVAQGAVTLVPAAAGKAASAAPAKAEAVGKAAGGCVWLCAGRGLRVWDWVCGFECECECECVCVCVSVSVGVGVCGCDSCV
jgi:hypothetical protein